MSVYKIGTIIRCVSHYNCDNVIYMITSFSFNQPYLFEYWHQQFFIDDSGTFDNNSHYYYSKL